MDKRDLITLGKKSGQRLLSAAGGTALLALATVAYADAPVTMAPPVDGDYSQAYSDDTTNASADSVFSWNDIPQNQRVPLNRAIFDRSGYQLYDDQGETILVPFANDNLYVMKFAQTSGDEMYFVNDGGVPVLYVPEGAYLENATVPGAKWYPFSDNFHPATPVFLGIAPSWDDYCTMGWYPNMVCYGGYYSSSPYWGSGSGFFASINLSFIFGGHHYHGWNSYHNYYHNHRAPYFIGNYGHNWGRPTRPYHGGGYGGGWGHDRVFRGGGHEYRVNHGGGDHGFHGGDRGGSVHVFRGGDRGDSNVHVFRGPGSRPGSGGDHADGGGHGFDRGNHNDGGHGFDGGNHNDGGGHVFHGGDRGDGGNGGGQPVSVYHGGDIGGKHPFPTGDNGGGRVFTGNNGNGGGRVFHGGGDSGGHSYGGGGGSTHVNSGGGGGARPSGGGGGHVETHSDGGNRSGGGSRGETGGGNGGGSHGGGGAFNRR